MSGRILQASNDFAEWVSCVECGKEERTGVTLYETVEGAPMFRELAPCENAHLECYIDRCVRRAIERFVKEGK